MERRRESGGGAVVGVNTFCGRTTIISRFESFHSGSLHPYDEDKPERK
jgi:hypothetical protein